MGDGKSQSQVITAARFFVEFPHLGKIAFSELGGITSKVASTAYIYNNDKGETIHTKQYGQTDPPTITLKRGLDIDGNAKLLAWHAMARQGAPNARGLGTLTVMDASGQAEIVYTLVDGWCSELSISQMKAGDSAVATIECKITCAEIVVPPAAA